MDYYEILRVPRTAPILVIKKAYRGLVLEWHPDKNTSPGANEMFMKIKEASECLMNEEKRARYDQTLRGVKVVPSVPSVSKTQFFSAEDLASLSPYSRTVWDVLVANYNKTQAWGSPYPIPPDLAALIQKRAPNNNNTPGMGSPPPAAQPPPPVRKKPPSTVPPKGPYPWQRKHSEAEDFAAQQARAQAEADFMKNHYFTPPPNMPPPFFPYGTPPFGNTPPPFYNVPPVFQKVPPIPPREQQEQNHNTSQKNNRKTKAPREKKTKQPKPPKPPKKLKKSHKKIIISSDEEQQEEQQQEQQQEEEIVIEKEEEENDNVDEKMPLAQCCICVEDAKTVYLVSHPRLSIPICNNCLEEYLRGDFTPDATGGHLICTWCADGGNLLCCDTCPNAFCTECLASLSGTVLKKAKASKKWSCLLCLPPTEFKFQRQAMQKLETWRKKQNKKKVRKPQKQRSSAKVEPAMPVDEAESVPLAQLGRAARDRATSSCNGSSTSSNHTDSSGASSKKSFRGDFDHADSCDSGSSGSGGGTSWSNSSSSDVSSSSSSAGTKVYNIANKGEAEDLRDRGIQCIKARDYDKAKRLLGWSLKLYPLPMVEEHLNELTRIVSGEVPSRQEPEPENKEPEAPTSAPSGETLRQPIPDEAHGDDDTPQKNVATPEPKTKGPILDEADGETEDSVEEPDKSPPGTNKDKIVPEELKEQVPNPAQEAVEVADEISHQPEGTSRSNSLDENSSKSADPSPIADCAFSGDNLTFSSSQHSGQDSGPVVPCSTFQTEEVSCDQGTEEKNCTEHPLSSTSFFASCFPPGFCEVSHGLGSVPNFELSTSVPRATAADALCAAASFVSTDDQP